jgi:hypothetical protein
MMIVLRAASLVNELRCELWHLQLDQSADYVTAAWLTSGMAGPPIFILVISGYLPTKPLQVGACSTCSASGVRKPSMLCMFFSQW